MTARTGLVDLISQLRGLTNAGTADYTIGGQTFWDDDRMQEILDRHRIDISREQLSPCPAVATGGVPVYKEYKSRYKNLEKTTGGTAIFIVENGVGDDAGTASWSADYARGLITFVSDQAGTPYYLTGRSYDLFGAAADVWRMKASYFAEQFDFSTDNHSVSRSQKVKHAIEMADMYEEKSTGSGENVVTFYRSDNYP